MQVKKCLLLPLTKPIMVPSAIDESLKVREQLEGEVDTSSLALPDQYSTTIEGYELVQKLWEKDCQLTKEGREYCQKEIRNNLRNLIGIYQHIVDNPDIVDASTCTGSRCRFIIMASGNVLSKLSRKYI